MQSDLSPGALHGIDQEYEERSPLIQLEVANLGKQVACGVHLSDPQFVLEVSKELKYHFQELEVG